MNEILTTNHLRKMAGQMRMIRRWICEKYGLILLVEEKRGRLHNDSFYMNHFHWGL